MGLFDDLHEKFEVLEDGRYLVKVVGFTREKTKNGARPIRWNLELLNEVKGSLPPKFSHVETDAGFRILMDELRKLGLGKPKNAAELEEACNRLKGRIVEINLFTTNQAEGYREIRFIRELSWFRQ